MEVKIGVRDVSREVVLQSEQTPADVAAAVEEAIDKGTILNLTDDRGRLLLVPGSLIGYVEIGAPSPRKVGFGA